jgi:glycolate oxidase iron-sulfur subunit
MISTLAAEEQKLLACIHCGLCLEACPTYVLTGNENDGPRGRLYLMRAVGEGRLAGDSNAFQKHIDRCLGCRACEAVCPAGVEYGELLEASRGQLFDSPVNRAFVYSLLRFVLRKVWLQPARLSLAFRLARYLRDLRLTQFLLKTKIASLLSSRFEFALALLESSRGTKHIVHAKVSQSPAKGAVLIFKSCVTEGLFSRVNEATQRVLAVNGVNVRIPEEQVCCGALHAHAGDLESARLLARRNVEAFGAGDSPIITNAGGCGAMLLTYGHLLGNDEQLADRARAFSARVRDVSQQLEATGVRQGAPVGNEKVTYDASCHLLYGQHAGDTPLKVLASVPNLNFVPLLGAERCCGGAGVYNVLEREMSKGVLKEKLANIKDSGATVLATGNAGCQMQIGAGALLSGLPLRVCHPVELLDESYRRAGYYD